MSKRKHKHTKEAIKQRGEVFTPTKLVNQMLDKLPPEVFSDKTKTFLDNSCGNGQFLFEVMRRKMICLSQQGMSFYDAHKQALFTIYGIELDSKNAEECRQRLLGQSKSKELREIVDNNIICADALDQNHEGWSTVGFYWDPTIMPQPKKEELPKKHIAEQFELPIVTKPVVKEIPAVIEKKTTFPISMVRTISAKEFQRNLEHQVSHGETF